MTDRDPLYAIADRYMHLLTSPDVEDMDEQTFSDTLDSIQGEAEVKAEHVALYIQGLRGKAEQVSAAAEGLAKRAKRLESRADQLQDYLLFHLKRVGIERVSGTMLDMRVSPGRPRVVIDDEAAIPDEFVVMKRQPVKAEIKKQLEAGNPIAGAHIEKGPDFLVMKI